MAENNRPVGVFSERDALLKLNTAAAELSNRPVSEFMTPKPQTLDTDARLAFAVQRMDMGAYRHLPIVDARGDLAFDQPRTVGLKGLPGGWALHPVQWQRAKRPLG